MISGNYIFASQFLFFTKDNKTIKVMLMGHLLGSVPNKHVSRPGHLCSTTGLHYNAVLSQILPRSKNCSYCDFDIALGFVVV